MINETNRSYIYTNPFETGIDPLFLSTWDDAESCLFEGDFRFCEDVAEASSCASCSYEPELSPELELTEEFDFMKDSLKSAKRNRLERSNVTVGATRYYDPEVAYFIALDCLFKNTLPKCRPQNISNHEWNIFTLLEKDKKLIHVLSKAPFIFRTFEKLDFAFYMLARYGYEQSMYTVDSLESLKECKNWFSLSTQLQMEFLNNGLDEQRQKFINNRSIKLPAVVTKYLNRIPNEDTIVVISRILDRTLHIALGRKEYLRAITFGAESCGLRTSMPLNEAFKLAISEIIPTEPFRLLKTTEYDDLSTSLEQGPQKRQRTGPSKEAAVPSEDSLGVPLEPVWDAVKAWKGTLYNNLIARYYALSYLISGQLPTTKPNSISDFDWGYLLEAKYGGHLVCNIQFLENDTSGYFMMSFKVHCALDHFCKCQAILGMDEAISSNKPSVVKSDFRWWSTDKNAVHNPFAINNKLLETESGQWIIHTINLPNQISQNSQFRSLSAAEKLNFIKSIIDEIIQVCSETSPLAKRSKSRISPQEMDDVTTVWKSIIAIIVKKKIADLPVIPDKYKLASEIH